MPCWELFDEQSMEYKVELFPNGIPVVSVEASSTLGWEKFAHYSVGMRTFGASAPIKDLLKLFGFTVENIVEKTKKTIEFYGGKPAPSLLISRPF